MELAILRGGLQFVIDNFDHEYQNDVGEKMIHLAIAYGKRDIFDFLLSRDVDINVQDEFGVTPLMVTIDHGQWEMAEICLEHSNLNLHLVNVYGGNVVNCLTHIGKVDLLKIVLQKAPGINVNLKVNEDTPLYYVLEKQSEELINLLFPFSDLNVTSTIGNYMHAACSFSRWNIVQKFLPFFDINIPNDDGLTPVNIAAMKSNHLVLKNLLRTDKVTLSESQLLFQVKKPNSSVRIIYEYFHDPLYRERWDKEENPKESMATDLLFLQDKYRNYLIEKSELQRFFSLMDKLNDDTKQILCLRTYGSCKNHIPTGYLRVSCLQN